MKTKKYKARGGATFLRKDAQKIGEELENIKQKQKLTPETIVERAKSKKSILHKYFEWDNNKAAEKYRLQQARDITSHIVEVVVVRGEEIEQKAFFSVTTKDEGNAYVSFTEAVTNKNYKKQLLDEMQTTLENLLNLIKLFSSVE